MKLPIKLPQGLTRTVGKLWLKTKNARPEISIGAGIVCGAAAMVMVGVKTWKGKETLSEDMKALKGATKKSIQKEAESNPDVALMSEEERRKHFGNFVGILAKDICKIYWIPVVLGVSSAGLVWGGRTLLRKELSAMSAAYAALSESYNRYRQRVIAEYGAEKDQEFQYGYKMVEAVDSETGEVTKVPMIDKEANLSAYAFWFNEGEFNKDTGTYIWKNYKFDRDSHVNRMKVIEEQNNATYELNAYGYVTLEDVALRFGIDPETAGKWHDYGWIWQPDRQNIVEFGVLEGPHQLEVNKGFTSNSCSQNFCLINPNVDGYIGFIREDLRKYDRRYGKGEREHTSIKRQMLKVINQRHAEEMGRMIEDATK